MLRLFVPGLPWGFPQLARQAELSLARLSFHFEVYRRCFTAVVLNLELDLLAFIERIESGALNGRDVHEYILAANCWRNEPISLFAIEPFYRAARHRRSSSSRNPQLTRNTRCGFIFVA